MRTERAPAVSVGEIESEGEGEKEKGQYKEGGGRREEDEPGAATLAK